MEYKNKTSKFLKEINKLNKNKHIDAELKNILLEQIMI